MIKLRFLFLCLLLSFTAYAQNLHFTVVEVDTAVARALRSLSATQRASLLDSVVRGFFKDTVTVNKMKASNTSLVLINTSTSGLNFGLKPIGDNQVYTDVKYKAAYMLSDSAGELIAFFGDWGAWTKDIEMMVVAPGYNLCLGTNGQVWGVLDTLGTMFWDGSARYSNKSVTGVDTVSVVRGIFSTSVKSKELFNEMSTFSTIDSGWYRIFSGASFWSSGTVNIVATILDTVSQAYEAAANIEIVFGGFSSNPSATSTLYMTNYGGTSISPLTKAWVSADSFLGVYLYVYVPKISARSKATVTMYWNDMVGGEGSVQQSPSRYTSLETRYAKMVSINALNVPLTRYESYSDTTKFTGQAVRTAKYIEGAAANDIYIVTPRSADGLAAPLATDLCGVFAKTDSLILTRQATNTADLVVNILKLR
jgi:hypothetical protein